MVSSGQLDLQINTRSSGNREVAFHFANAPPACILKLPGIIKEAAESSRQYSNERHQGLATTSVISLIFPKDNSEDASLTIWLGNTRGYGLADFFGLNHVPN